MIRSVAQAALVFSAFILAAPCSLPQAPASPHNSDTFEVATIKQVEHDAKSGRFIVMQGTNRFVARAYSLKLLIAAAYDLNPHAVIGGPAWMEEDRFDITALTPGESRPARPEQMAMLRNLLHDRFNLAFHREEKEFSIYELSQAKGGAKLKASAAPPDEPPALISTVFPEKIVLPARNTTMTDFVAILQRAILDRPVVDKTGLTGRYDFDLEWAPDETQFGGEVPVAPSDAPSAPLFTAIQQQLGLRLEATRGPVAALVVDKAEKPSPN